MLSVAGQASAQDCDTDQNPIEYDSSNEILPQDSTVPGQDWQTLCGGTQGQEDFGTNPGGILIIDDTSTSKRASYCKSSMFRTDCDGEQEAVYEFSTKVISTTPPAAWGPDLAFICGLRDVENDFRVAVTEDDGVGFFDGTNWLVIANVDQRVDVTWNKHHLFRIEKDANEVRLYMDNEDDPSVTVARANLVNNAAANRADLAVTSTPGKAKFELSLFRYRIGITEFTIPTTNACAGDINGDDVVDIDDLDLLFAAWGDCIGCDEDINGDDVVGIDDLNEVLYTWGICP